MKEWEFLAKCLCRDVYRKKFPHVRHGVVISKSENGDRNSPNVYRTNV